MLGNYHISLNHALNRSMHLLHVIIKIIGVLETETYKLRQMFRLDVFGNLTLLTN